MPNATTPPNATQPDTDDGWRAVLELHPGHRCYIVGKNTLRCVDCEQTLDLTALENPLTPPLDASPPPTGTEPCPLFWCEVPHQPDIDGTAFHRSGPLDLAAGITATVTGSSEEDGTLLELALELEADADRQIPLGVARAAGAALIALADRIEIGTGRG
jgi:hypothetical protein